MGEKSPTMGKDLQFCRPNLMMNGFIDVEDLTPVLARWCFLAVHVKRLLRKYGYPPDLQDAAVQNVLQQAKCRQNRQCKIPFASSPDTAGQQTGLLSGAEARGGGSECCFG
jgi:hypothetical protein